MRLQTLLAGVLVGALALSATSFTSAQDDEPTPLQAAMGKLMGAQKSMRKSAGDPVANKDALLRSLGAIEEAVLTAYAHEPAAPEGEDEHAWSVGYRRAMLEALDAALACELATHQGDADAFAEAYKALGATKKRGHDAYKR